MSVRCGRCHQRHESVQEVRACYNGEQPAAIPEATPAAYRATPNQVDWILKMLKKRHMVMDADPEQLPKRGDGSASTLLDYFFDKTGNAEIPQGFGLRADPAWQSADGNPSGHGDPTACDEGSQGRTNEPFPDVPAGYYATPSLTGNNDYDFWRVDRPTEGRWAGFTFVKRVIGGHDDTDIPRDSRKKVKSERVAKVTQRSALKAIVEFGIQKSNELFGQELKYCRKCGIHLTDEVSRAVGMGPDCRSKAGVAA